MNLTAVSYIYLAAAKADQGEIMEWLYGSKITVPRTWRWTIPYRYYDCHDSIDASVPTIMYMSDIGCTLCPDRQETLQLARQTFCTFHGLLRWCSRLRADQQGIPDCLGCPLSESSGQGLLRHLSELPQDLLMRIAIEAKLQHYYRV